MRLRPTLFGPKRGLFRWCAGPSRSQLTAQMAALLALNQAHACGELWRYLDRNCGEDMAARVKLARRLREVTYKATSLVALPMAINAATALKDAMDPEVLEALPSDPRLVSQETLTPTIDRAKAFWSRIYVRQICDLALSDRAPSLNERSIASRRPIPPCSPAARTA